MQSVIILSRTHDLQVLRKRAMKQRNHKAIQHTMMSQLNDTFIVYIVFQNSPRITFILQKAEISIDATCTIVAPPLVIIMPDLIPRDFAVVILIWIIQESGALKPQWKSQTPFNLPEQLILNIETKLVKFNENLPKKI